MWPAFFGPRQAGRGDPTHRGARAGQVGATPLCSQGSTTVKRRSPVSLPAPFLLSQGTQSHPALRGLGGPGRDARRAQPRSPSAPYSRSWGETAPGPVLRTTPGTPPRGRRPGTARAPAAPGCRSGAWGPVACRIPDQPRLLRPRRPDFPSLPRSLPPSLLPSRPPAPDTQHFSWGALPLGPPSHPAQLWDSGRSVLNVLLRERMAREARCGPGPRGAVVWKAVLLLLCLEVPTGRPYNVDTESALLYQGPPNTLFGYSVVLHSHGANRW